MRCLVLITFDTASGEYEIEVRNLGTPGSGIDYDIFREALARVMDDLDRRVTDVRETGVGRVPDVFMFGDGLDPN